MKKLFIVLLLSCMPVLAQEGSLRKAEPLTEQEKKDIADAEQQVRKATTDLQEVKARIAADHKMTSASWMEYSVWYEFDGDFILQRYRSNMTLTTAALGGK